MRWRLVGLPAVKKRLLVVKPVSTTQQGWRLFDGVVADSALKHVSPWVRDETGAVRFEPDYDTLSKLLAVPVFLGAASQSGVPAIAFDVWVSYELRRAGFDGDKVWPRPGAPRVLPTEVRSLLDALPVRLRADVQERIDTGRAGSAVGASANVLGKNYLKQVDVVMSAWHTGPELMISTKRMDSSFAKNAANRVEESYGDAKNLRGRYPQSALGFVYGLNARAFSDEPHHAAWLVDLLGKLGREDDAYDAVALVVQEDGVKAADDGDEPSDPLMGDESSAVVPDEGAPVSDSVSLAQDLAGLSPVGLRRDLVPAEVSPERFFAVMTERVLSGSPINFHVEARRRRSAV